MNGVLCMSNMTLYPAEWVDIPGLSPGVGGGTIVT